MSPEYRRQHSGLSVPGRYLPGRLGPGRGEHGERRERRRWRERHRLRDRVRFVRLSWFHSSTYLGLARRPGRGRPARRQGRDQRVGRDHARARRGHRRRISDVCGQHGDDRRTRSDAEGADPRPGRVRLQAGRFGPRFRWPVSVPADAGKDGQRSGHQGRGLLRRTVWHPEWTVVERNEARLWEAAASWR